jgi:hypothetical protein
MTINYLAVLVAAIAGYGFGAIYYTSLSAAWLDAVGLKKEQLSTSKVPFVVAGVANLVMAWALAGLMGHLGPITIRAGIISAGFCWLGFVATTIAVNNTFPGRKPKLSIIDGIHWLGVLVIQGAIIGAFGA